MKRILLLLLFSISVWSAFAQSYGNTYHKSIHIINSDSTHGELDGTEYINNDGKFRYKENGVWKYRASTADIASAGITNSAAEDELMKSDGTNAVGTGIFSTSNRTLTAGANNLQINYNALQRILVASNGVLIGHDLASPDAFNRLHVTANSTSGIVYPLKLSMIDNSGGPNVGNGAGVVFDVNTNSTNRKEGSIIESVSTDITVGSEDFDLVFKNMAAGALASEKFRITSVGAFGIGGANYGTSGQVLTSNGSSSAPSWQTPSSASPAGSTNAIQINSSGSFGAGNMAVSMNSVYNLSAGTNWHLGWNASGTGGSVDARRMTIGALGVSIGAFVTDPLTSLHVEKSVSGVGGGDDIGEAIRMRSTYNAITPLVGSGVRLSFESETSDGNYEIGGAIEAVTTDVTSASEDFDFVFYNMAAGATATETFRVTSAGNATLIGTGTGVDWVATSDRRLKYNFKPVYNQLDKIGTIADLVTNYDRKDNGKNETGFIAQELLKVAPEYVNVPQDTASGYYSVNYSKMVVPLYTGVNELQEEVVALRQEVAELKAIVKEFRRITLEASAK